MTSRRAGRVAAALLVATAALFVVGVNAEGGHHDESTGALATSHFLRPSFERADMKSLVARPPNG